jgi:hypothetical protein
MKTRLIVLSLLAVVALTSISAIVAYRLGFRHGVDAERVCWALEPAPPEAWLHGVITAHRDTTKHPYLKPARLVLRGDRSVNSIPSRVDF